MTETKIGDLDLFINLPSGVTVKHEAGMTYSFVRGSEILGLINDTGTDKLPDEALLAGACDLGDPKEIVMSGGKGLTCGKDGKFRSIAFVKVNGSKVKNVLSCNFESGSRAEVEEVCQTLSGPRINY